MCILLTPVLFCITTVLIEVCLQCFTESVGLNDIGKPTSRADIISPSPLHLKAVKGANLWSALREMFFFGCNCQSTATNIRF